MFNELDKIKTSNKELMLYMSVLAKMVAAGNPDSIKNLQSEED